MTFTDELGVCVRSGGVARRRLSPQAAATSTSPSGQSRPNVLLIVADDVGFWNVGAYSHAMMVPTPSLDRIAREGMLFTDHYAQPTCTPGRAALITGQLPIRTRPLRVYPVDGPSPTPGSTGVRTTGKRSLFE